MELFEIEEFARMKMTFKGSFKKILKSLLNGFAFYPQVTTLKLTREI
jgi:hypothetical protein